MALPPEQVHRIADQLFAAFTAHDADAARTLLAPGFRSWSNAFNRESTAEEFLALLPMLRATIGRHRYEDVRRLVADEGLVEQHRVRSTTEDGTELDFGDACVVVRLDEAGLVTRLDEYVDTALAQRVLAG